MPDNTMAKNKSDIFNEIGRKLQAITTEPEQFLRAQPEKYSNVCQVLQQMYGATTAASDARLQAAHVLQELVVEDMDEEQIWQQLELRNDIALPQFLEQTSKFLALNEEKLEVRLNEAENESEPEEALSDESNDKKSGRLSDDLFNAEDDEDDDDDDEEAEINYKGNEKAQTKRRIRSSIVDDKFFKLGEMEEFLDAEDAKEMRKQNGKRADEDDDGIDYFADELGDEDEDDDNPKYKDFFDNELSGKEERTTKKEKDHFVEDEVEAEAEDEDEDDEDIENDNEDDENEYKSGKEDIAPTNELVPAADSESDSEDEPAEDQPKSSFEQRQERLHQRIRDYEQEVLGEKPWQLKGEIKATNRPQNSLLEEILEFESTVRPAPVITEETTLRLEDIIRQRIKDQAWDDVESKVRPVQTPQDYRKQLVLDQEKSKESLAQVYEKEYQRELEKLDSKGGNETAEEVPKEHREIRRLMRDLFVKLDALSNFHFTPKPVAPEPKIITNTPAVAMEEVAPVAVSDAKLLAPEEVYRGPKTDLLGKSERNRTDKNRERRKKKQKQGAIHKALEAKDVRRQKMGIPLTKKEENAKLLKTITKHRNVDKITASNDQSSLKSSKAFFSKLQDTTTTQSNAKTKAHKKKADDAKSALSAKKLKL